MTGRLNRHLLRFLVREEGKRGDQASLGFVTWY